MIPWLVASAGVAAALLGFRQITKNTKLSPAAYNKILDAITASTDPDWLDSMAKALANAGFQDLAVSAAQKAKVYRDARAASAKGQVYKGDNYTPSTSAVTLPVTTISAGISRHFPW